MGNSVPEEHTASFFRVEVKLEKLYRSSSPVVGFYLP
jgi:hypothetical protein